MFLSTSRVYPIEPQNRLNVVEGETRFELTAEQPFPGVSGAGISEAFPLDGARSIYGATKLASELLLEEYRATYGLRTIVNRCGVLAGPWQMGKVDQGVFTLWVLSHLLGRPLRYIGYGGTGKQVRDLLHVRDLFELLSLELGRMDELSGSVFNVGGGRGVSLSLCETTRLCSDITGRSVPVESVAENRFADVPIYLTDTAKVAALTGWAPRTSAAKIIEEIDGWARERLPALEAALG
jgi:CDP-paratose 2-epimerase